MASRSPAQGLGLTAEEGASGRHTSTEALCRATETLGDGVRSGGAPASEASVRAQGPRERGERARLDISSALVSQSTAWGPVTPPAKSQQVLAGRFAKPERFEISDLLANDSAKFQRPVDPPAPKATDPRPRMVGRRVDSLVVAFAVNVTPAFHDELIERQSIADENGVAQLTVTGLPFAMKRSRRRDAVSFENTDIRGLFDERAASGWLLELTLRATFLATHSLEEAIDLAKLIASGFGTVAAARLRRFDLAVDFIEFPLAHEDIKRIVTQRANVNSFSPEAKDFDAADTNREQSSIVEHRKPDHAVTGFSIASGNPLMARVYDKTEELLVQGSDEKRAIEHAIWQSNGWDGIARVTRVEFQHRGSYLDEIDQRNIDTLVRFPDGFDRHSDDIRSLIPTGFDQDSGASDRHSEASDQLSGTSDH